MTETTVTPVEGRIRALLRRWPVLLEAVKYFGASAVALAVDWGLLSLLTRGFAVPPLVAAAVGFSAGVVVVYLLSVRFVFRDHVASDRRWEFLVFVLIGVAGLGLTELLMGILVHGAGLAADVAKAPIAVATFLFNFGLRKALLFSRRQR